MEPISPRSDDGTDRDSVNGPDPASGGQEIDLSGYADLSDAQRENLRALAALLAERFGSPEFQNQMRTAVRAAAQAAESVTEWYRRNAPAIEQVARTLATVLQTIAASYGPVTERILPTNWCNLPPIKVQQLLDLMFEEGIALAWVPPRAVLVRLIEAPDQAARRKIIGNASTTIIDACELELDLVRRVELQAEVKFAVEAVETLRAGYVSASQALSTNLLDSVLRRHLAAEHRTVTRQKSQPDLERYSFKSALTFAGIWGAHGEYFASRGDPIPKFYSRHGSVHGVSVRQYSKRNAVIALMHVTALLRLLEDEPIQMLDANRLD